MATTPITSESLLAAINEVVLAVEQAQETLVAKMDEFVAHKATKATDKVKAHVALSDTMGDESAAAGGTALTPKALKDFDAGNTNVVINVRDMLRAEIEAVTGGRNTIVRDVHDTPHVMVVVPKFRLENIDESLGTGVHPAFIVDGVEKSEILIGKYSASKGLGDVPETLPRKAPYGDITLGEAVDACRELGNGFCCVTNAMRNARALYLWKYFGGSEGEHVYQGNSSYGETTDSEFMTGTLASSDATLGSATTGVANLTLTGSGPVEWNDDCTPYGICDFFGNTLESAPGFRLVAGEIQVIPDNDAALADINLGLNSATWKAILEDGTLVAPGTSGTLKYTSPSSGVIAITDGESSYGTSRFAAFSSVSAGNLTVPAILKALGLYPIASNVQGRLYFGGTGFDEAMIPFRGGYYRNGIGPGQMVFYRTNSSAKFTGFRVGYVA